VGPTFAGKWVQIKVAESYQEQWKKLLSISDEIKQFIAENQDKLKVKEG